MYCYVLKLLFLITQSYTPNQAATSIYSVVLGWVYLQFKSIKWQHVIMETWKNIYISCKDICACSAGHFLKMFFIFTKMVRLIRKMTNFCCLKCSPRTSAVTNNPNQNVYHLPPSLCILWHPLVCLARLVFTCQLYCPAHIVFRIRCFLLCSSVLCRDYVNTEFSKALGYR